MPRRERLYRPPSQPIAQSTQNFCRFKRVPTSQWATTKAKSAGIQDKTCRNYLICLSPNEYIDCNQYLVWPLDRFEPSFPDSTSGVLVQARRQSIRFNGPSGDRTHDSYIKSVVLYQLSYWPKTSSLTRIYASTLSWACIHLFTKSIGFEPISPA